MTRSSVSSSWVLLEPTRHTWDATTRASCLPSPAIARRRPWRRRRRRPEAQPRALRRRAGRAASEPRAPLLADGAQALQGAEAQRLQGHPQALQRQEIARSMTVFPGQLGNLKEGRLGSLAKLDTQNPVMYIEYPGFGRLKLCGTIGGRRHAILQALNVKSKDRLNLEDWFDSMIELDVLRRDRGNQPGRGADAVSGGGSTSKPPPRRTNRRLATHRRLRLLGRRRGGRRAEEVGVSADRCERDGAKNDERFTEDQSSDEDVDETTARRGDGTLTIRRTASRPSAAAARVGAPPQAPIDFSEVDDFDLEEEEEEEEKVFRGRVTATVEEAARTRGAEAQERRRRGRGRGEEGQVGLAEPAEPAAVFLQTGYGDGVRRRRWWPSATTTATSRRSGAGCGGKQTSLLGFLGGRRRRRRRQAIARTRRRRRARRRRRPSPPRSSCSTATATPSLRRKRRRRIAISKREVARRFAGVKAVRERGRRGVDETPKKKSDSVFQSRGTI